MARVRLDTLLAERGLFASRSRAAASVTAGEVLVGAERRPAARPSQLVAADVPLEVAGDAERFVSRGAIKLANALDALGIDVAGRDALDVGASTGGFTDVLLRRGAARVAAVDVASDELDPGLRADERVSPLCLNARELTPADLPFVPDLLVLDVSFISATKVLPAVLGCLAPRFDALVMVKPQFEVGPRRVGKNGVVRDPEDRRAAILDVAESAYASVLGFASSGLPGPKGNQETFVWLAEPGRPGAVSDLEAAVREVEP
jgi:23S rRNA (cytidine1920-2'-O)/16S rRNA (cytidine1409-2'-O)-methyltransferase